MNFSLHKGFLSYRNIVINFIERKLDLLFLYSDILNKILNFNNKIFRFL